MKYLNYIRKIKWDYVKRLMDLFQFFIVVLGVTFSVYQINDMFNNQLSRKNQLSIFYYDRLNSGINNKISIAIENGTPILKRFNYYEIDDYLNDLHGVGEVLNRGLLDSEIVCSDFSDIAIKAYKNIEIQRYLMEVRKEDEGYFQDFDNLYEFLVSSCD